MASHVCVLTAGPAGLADSAIETAERALGSEARRLGPTAAEIPCGAETPLPEIAGADVNRIPTANRRKRILIADMDSTMIPVECIDEIAAEAGIGARVAAITERAMAGELDFEAALRERVSLLAGFPVVGLERVLAERIALNPGGRLLVRTMAEHGAHTALVSGGFTWFTERVGALAGFAENRANRLEIADGRLTGRAVPPILGRAAKLEALDEICAREGLTRADALALGDGANDLAMIEAAGLGVGVRPKPALAAKADAVIREADLSAVLHLQGFETPDFAAG